MTSPFLALAAGALKGQLNNRAAGEQRAHDAEAAELRKIALLRQAGYSMHPVASAPAGAAPAMPTPAAPSPVLSAALQAIAGGGDAGGMAPMDPDPADVPATPPAAAAPASPLPPLHQAAMQALQAPADAAAAPAAPAAAARRTVPVNLPGLPPMEFDVSEDPETKEERAARLKQEATAADRTRKVAMWTKKVGDPAIAEILADRPELYQELTTTKPETQSAYFDRLVAKGMTPEDAAHLSRMRFQGVTPKDADGAGKEPSWQIVQTDAGMMQVNPKTGETRPVQGPGGQPLQAKVPPTQATGYRANKALTRKIQDAIAQLEAHPDAVGFTRGRSDGVDQRLDPKGVPARAALAAVAGQKFHDLSGAAVSASEAARLKPFIPSASDNAKTALRKLKQMLLEVEGQQQDFEETYPALKSGATTGAAGGTAGTYHPQNPYAPRS